ncbi:MAG: fatty acid desaturase [Verrucomicrobiota bacterium]
MSQANQPLLASTELRRWTRVSPFRNLVCIGGEYLGLLSLHFAAIYCLTHFEGWGVPVWGSWLVGIVTVLLTGCFMHRIGLMGHEASHGLLIPNRVWNERLANLLCFFPLWSSAASYRAKHQGHHYHPNDPEKDPNLSGHKASELYARFPMPRPSFIWNYYAKFFWPPFVFRNLLDLFRVLAVGQSPAEAADPKKPKRFLSPTMLGILYLIGLIATIRTTATTGSATFMVVLPVAFLAAGLTVWKFLPMERFGKPGKRQEAKTSAAIRLVFYTVLLLTIGWVRFFTGFNLTFYYVIFWLVPLVYVFPYLMLLREIYQHANLGTGKLDNSRIIHADPFTRWALLGYGNDFHLVHHLYPNIPHYHLRAAHEAMVEQSAAYRASLVETSGVFHAPEGQNSLLASLESKEEVGSLTP